MSTRHTPTAAPAQTIYISRSRGCVGPLLLLSGWIAFLICLGVLYIQQLPVGDYLGGEPGLNERYVSGSKVAEEKIAIIQIGGVIVDGEGFVRRQIDAVRDDANVKAVVLRIDSPGGTVNGSDYIYHHLDKLRREKKIPMVASMGGIAASGGYYVAMAVGDQPKSIYAEPTTTTGSIGVIVPHYDLSGLLARFDVKDDSIATHPRKQMLSMTRPIPDEHRELIEKYIGESFELFKQRVQAGRPAFKQDPSKLEALATGEIFTASQAQQNGLIDEIGFLEDAVSRAAELANLNEEKVRVVRYRGPPTLLEMAGFIQAPSPAMEMKMEMKMEMEALVDASTPRAWFLHSSLPLLAAAHEER